MKIIKQEPNILLERKRISLDYTDLKRLESAPAAPCPIRGKGAWEYQDVIFPFIKGETAKTRGDIFRKILSTDDTDDTDYCFRVFRAF